MLLHLLGGRGPLETLAFGDCHGDLPHRPQPGLGFRVKLRPLFPCLKGFRFPYKPPFPTKKSTRFVPRLFLGLARAEGIELTVPSFGVPPHPDGFGVIELSALGVCGLETVDDVGIGMAMIHRIPRMICMPMEHPPHGSSVRRTHSAAPTPPTHSKTPP